MSTEEQVVSKMFCLLINNKKRQYVATHYYQTIEQARKAKNIIVGMGYYYEIKNPTI